MKKPSILFRSFQSLLKALFNGLCGKIPDFSKKSGIYPDKPAPTKDVLLAKFKSLKFVFAVCLGLGIALSENCLMMAPLEANTGAILIPIRREPALIESWVTQANSELVQSNISSEPLKLLQQGKAFYEAEQFAEAVKVWQQAEKLFAAEKDVSGQSLVLSFLSLAYQKLGQWEEAKRAIAESLQLINNNINSTKEQAQIQAIALNTQGRLQLSLGQSEDALNTLQQATAAYKKAGDEEGITGSLINQAQTLQTLGFYRRAYKTLEELENRIQNQPDSPIKVKGLLSLGIALRVSGDLEKSRQLSQQSLEIAQRLQSPAYISTALLNLGNTEQAIGKRAEDAANFQQIKERNQAAIEYYRQAANISNSANTRLQAQVNQLRLLLETKQWSSAQELWPQIDSQIAQLPPSRATIYARINLVDAALQGGRVAKVLGSNLEFSQPANLSSFLAKAVREAQSLGDKRAESYALGTLGELYEQSGQLSDAEHLTKQALQLASAINASDIAYLWEWQLGRLYKVEKDLKKANVAYTEAVNTLQSLRSDLVAINPEIQFSFRDRVEPVYRQLVDLLLQPDEGEKVSQKNLIQARQVIESLQLAELDNFFREACLDAKPEQIDRLDLKAAVIYPVILPDRLEVILSLPQQPLQNYRTKVEQNLVESTIFQLEQDTGIRHSNQEERSRLAQQLYDWLIQPVETELKASGVQTLVFVLDGALRNIPMAALYNGQQYLIEQYNIALTPGLQLLKTQPLTREKLRALAGGVSEAHQGFSALPGVRLELQQINTSVNATTLLNQDFTSQSLERQVEAAPFPVVHLATHGQFSSNFQQTFILAWDGPINVKQLDELLRTRNPGFPRQIELLVLSACETATGDKRAALGLAGVAVRAGARSTLATLWKVSDESTAALMTEFYRQLANPGTSKAEALRRAQITLLQNRRYRNPYFWAPYVLVGNWL